MACPLDGKLEQGLHCGVYAFECERFHVLRCFQQFIQNITGNESGSGVLQGFGNDDVWDAYKAGQKPRGFG